MEVFEELLKIIKRCTKTKVKDDNLFENSFTEFNLFEVSYDSLSHNIHVLFTENVTDKEKKDLFNFVQSVFIYRFDLDFITKSILLLYGFKVICKAIPNTNDLKLFIGNIDL